ncbi:MAG: TlyA family RNA methyltransferase [Alphaproteobacteria bacterium]|nr:TlyA family RNA methyltransferase [Alphaproteobacteria bacterium]MBV9419108.1 TlyA family RNA methyltransferase [Alphaproteobacteria bacterium]MBV9541263.1 TlyA family RNA methyltransferase [Alphaproteobacteria bacterium]MBV9903038.1 TlyA family RNA methyltransferase [Alphaproteobacteria bacterium]
MSTPSTDESLRADVFLVQEGYAKSRTEAQSAIRSGRLRVNGQVIIKPSHTLGAADDVEYVKPHPYVSRGALKLIAALDEFKFSPEGLVCLDVGASTGGFTEVLLERGASKVFAIDVGHSQMHPKIRGNERVVSCDGVNARELNRTHVTETPYALTIDVSFIGLKLALPPALSMAGPGAWLIALVKPQFEVGRFAVGKGGIVKDAAAREAAVVEVERWINEQAGWTVSGRMDSPIEGGDGNREYLIGAKKV